MLIVHIAMQSCFLGVIDEKRSYVADSVVNGCVDAMQVAATRPLELTAEMEVDEAVFRQAFIARKLEEVEHFERDAQRLLEGNIKDIYFPTLTGMAADGTGAGCQPKVLLAYQNSFPSAQRTVVGSDSVSCPQNLGLRALNDEKPAQNEASVQRVADEAQRVCGSEDKSVSGAHVKMPHGEVPGSDSEVDESASQASDVTDVEGEWSERARMSPEEVKDARKANKQAVKAEQREKRLSKVPKKVKKRAEKKGKVKK